MFGPGPITIIGLMSLYGIYVIIRGRVGAGDGKGGVLVGVAARKIGLLYTLCPIVTFVNLIVGHYVCTLIKLNYKENEICDFILNFVVIGTIILFLLKIIKLSKALYLKQQEDKTPLQT
jgi:hypothetical protein